MKTFLLTWNPNRSPEPDMPRQANETAAGKIVLARWSCGNTKKIKIGYRVFLIRLGVEPKGIVGSGWVVKSSYWDEHWDAQRRTEGKKGLFITSLNDLAIVCANCHAMIHKGGKCRPLENLIRGK